MHNTSFHLQVNDACAHMWWQTRKCISFAVHLCSYLTGRVYDSKMQVLHFYTCSQQNIHNLGNAHTK